MARGLLRKPRSWECRLQEGAGVVREIEVCRGMWGVGERGIGMHGKD